MESEHDAAQPPDVGPGGPAPIDLGGGGDDDGDAGAPALPPKQEAAIVALLNQPTVKQAAQACGVGERTLHRWLGEPAFSAAYRKARRETFAHAVSLSQRYAAMAVNVLATVMNDTRTPWPSRVSAAVAVLKFGRESIELDDLAGRVEALESGSAAARKPLSLSA